MVMRYIMVRNGVVSYKLALSTLIYIFALYILEYHSNPKIVL